MAAGSLPEGAGLVLSFALGSGGQHQGWLSSGRAPRDLGASGQACWAGAWPVSWKVLLCPAAKEPGLPPASQPCATLCGPAGVSGRGICWEVRGSQAGAGGSRPCPLCSGEGWLPAILGGSSSGAVLRKRPW